LRYPEEGDLMLLSDLMDLKVFLDLFVVDGEGEGAELDARAGLGEQVL